MLGKVRKWKVEEGKDKVERVLKSEEERGGTFQIWGGRGAER